MWQPLSKLLDTLGRLRVPQGPPKVTIRIGTPGSVDALGDFEWRNYKSPEALYRVWGPLQDSPWEPYHCVPLFAALESIKPDAHQSQTASGPWPTDPAQATQMEIGPHLDGAAQAKPLGQAWVDAGVWVILDLPGTQSVPLAARFVLAGFQPVCTFDHWPHPQGLLHPELILAQLLRFAPVIGRARTTLAPGNPPVWICDRDRLGTRPGQPHEFDNRYFLDDSLLPGPEALRRSGIRQIICIVAEPTMRPLEDLHACFEQLRKEGFSEIHGAALSDPELRVFDFAPLPVPSRFQTEGYQRSASGGFGRLIPEQSSSSG